MASRSRVLASPGRAGAARGRVARFAHFIPLALALVAALYVYLPALDSPFVGDDYLLLIASRDMPFGEFLKAIWDPGASSGLLQLSDHYWRPLSFLSFRAIYFVFGANPAAFHAFNLVVHLASVVLVYALGWALTRSRAGASIAAAVMAVHPAGVESVTWISALNSAGLPLALGSWLAFLRAGPPAEGAAGRSLRLRWLATSLVLGALALAFRETSVVILVAMLIWYVAFGGVRSQSARTVAVLVGLPAAMIAIHALFLAGVTSSSAGGALISLDGEAIGTAWFYVRQGFTPVDPNGRPLFEWVRRVLGAVLLLIPVAGLVTRRWPVAVLGMAFVLSIVPYAFFSLGHGQRYFYFPGALLSLLLGAVTAEAARSAPPDWRPRALAAGSALALCAALASVAVGHRRVDLWVRTNPDLHEQWADAFKAEHPVLLADAGVYVVDLPFPMAQFDGYIVGPTVSYYYPGWKGRVYVVPRQYIDYARSTMGPADTMFIFEPD